VSQAVAWRDRLISFRTLMFIILGLGVVRLVVAFLMPQEPSIMAPDEGTYATLAGVVGSGGDWASWNYNWGAGLYPGSRALLGPAALLIYFGLPDLTAVRVISVLYAVGSQLLLLAIAWLARRRLAPDAPGGLPLISWPMLGVAVFVLMPSNVLWSNLGLREAACAFWILAAVTCAGYLFTTRDWRWKALCGAGIAASIAMTFQSRVYLAAALVIALAVGVVWFGRERPRFSITLALGIVAGTILGATLSLPATPATTTPAVDGTPSAGPGFLDSLQQGAAQAPTAINPDTYLERGSYQREVSAQYANSAIATDSCAGVPNPQSLRWCEIARLPGAAFAVMFRPLWPVDIPSEWSAMAVMASIENVAWLALAAAVIWVLITRRFIFMRLLTVSVAYGALVIAGMAALEGNFGTAFRHKSSTLWVFCSVLVLAGAARRPKKPKMDRQLVAAAKAND
jgi:hypothetical protein